MTTRRREFLLVGTALIVGIAVVPFIGDEYRTQLWTQAFTFAIAAVSLDLVWGYTGIPDLGHSVWFGIGALTVGLMTTTVSDTGLVVEAGGTAITYVLAVVVGTIAAAIAGGIVAWYSFPSRAANPFYIGIVGLALSTAIQPLYTQLPGITGGENGLFGFAYDGIGTLGWYYVCAACFVAVLVGALILVRSDFGVLIAAIRDNERRARYLGNDVERIKISVFALGAGGAGFAGALYGAVVGLVSAPLFGFQFATEMLVWVAVGGRATIIGPAASAIALSLVGSELNRSFPAQWNLALGALFVAAVVFVPDGFVAPWAKWLRRRIVGGDRVLEAEATPAATPAESEVLAAMKDVRFSYGALQVLRGIDLEIERGRLLCIVGPNGAGKSTLIEVLTDGRRPIAGSVTFNLAGGRGHRRRPPHAIAQEGLIRKFQIPALFRSLTVAEHLLLATHRGAWPSPFRRTVRVRIPAAVLAVNDATGLASRAAIASNALAHGLKQGLEIAMAVAAHPVLLLLDEPTAGLTANERAVIGNILRALVADGITIVLIEHDFDFVGEVADRVAVLHDGVVVQTGSFAEISASPVVRDAYLGIGAMRLAVEGLSARYGSATVIRDLSFAVGDGEAVAILGRNGMGKSTLLKAILGYVARDGAVSLDGEDIAAWPTARIVRRGIGYGPQEEAIFGELTVAENLAANVTLRHPSPARMAAVLEHFPVLGRRLPQRAGTLSGGEQKMLVLARVLLAEPKFIVLDEISAGLQPAILATVQLALAAERERRGTTILMVEQNLGLALALADRVAVMKLGQIVFEAPTGAAGIRPELETQLAP